MTAKRVVLPGGTGYLGQHLARRLIDRGDRVTVLTRGRSSHGDGWEAISWDGRAAASLSGVLEGADAIVHLSGKRVDCRPSKRNVDELIDSRVGPVRAVGEAWAGCHEPPKVWVQLSSLAGYGDHGDALIDERTPFPVEGPRQMTEVCKRWESAFASIAKLIPRTVLLRPAIAIGPGDPATRRLATLARLGLGGRVGSGRQWVSWIALEDCMSILVRAIDSPAMSGLYLATSPNPIRNAEMMASYRRAAGRRFGLRSPARVTRAGAWLLGSDPALALTGRRAIPRRLLDEGFTFAVPTFEEAVERTISVPGREMRAAGR